MSFYLDLRVAAQPPPPDPDPDPIPDPVPVPPGPHPPRIRFADDAWCSRPLADDAPLDSLVAEVQAEMVRQKARAQPYYNVVKWSAMRVAAEGATKPVYMTPRVGNSDLEWILLHHGVPYPDDLVLQNDHDCSVLVILPSGEFWELYGCNWRQPDQDPALPLRYGAAQPGDQLWCRHMGQMLGTNGPAYNRGCFVTKSPYRNADGTYPRIYEKKEMGSWGSSIPIDATLILREELEAGVASGPVGLAVIPGSTYTTRYRRWPAQRNDNGNQRLTPYGGILRLPPDWVIDTSKPRVAQMAEMKARDWGIIICDASGCLSFRTEPDVGEFFDGKGWGATAQMFPFGSLQLLAVS